MPIRGIRGAVQVDANNPEAIRAATGRLLGEITKQNSFDAAAIAAAFFTVTDDLDAAFPASGAREIGWADVPMLCHREISVPGSLPRVVRVLLLVNAPASVKSFRPVYLGATKSLRPDLAEPPREKAKRRSSTQKIRARLLGKSLSQGISEPAPPEETES